MPAPLQAVLNKGEILGNRYEIQELIKAGGMGCIYKIWDQRLQKDWALKVLNLNQYNPKDQQEMFLLFEREAKILSNFRHKGIPIIVDFFPEKNIYCFVMDFIFGQNLDEIIKQRKLDIKEVLKWGIELCEILEFLHQQTLAVLYRDMKPSNIMLTNDGTIVLVDFGVAGWLRVKTGQQTHTIAIMGSAGFAPPEQYLGKSDERSDIYGLGATLHFLLSGVDPSENPFIFSSLCKIRSEVSKELDEIIIKAIESTPERRFSTVTKFKQALQNVLIPSLNAATKTQSSVQLPVIYKRDARVNKSLIYIRKIGFCLHKTGSVISSTDRVESFNRLINYYKVGLLDEAINETLEIVQKLQKSILDKDIESIADFLFLLSQMYEQKGQYAKAIELLKETIQFRSNHQDAYNDLVRLNKQIAEKQKRILKQQKNQKFRHNVWVRMTNWIDDQLHPRNIANSICGGQGYICDIAIAIGMILGFSYWQIFCKTPLARFDLTGILGTIVVCLCFIASIYGMQCALHGLCTNNKSNIKDGLIFMIICCIFTFYIGKSNINFQGRVNQNGYPNIRWGFRAEIDIQNLPTNALKNLANSRGIKTLHNKNHYEIKIWNQAIDLFKFPEILTALKAISHDLRLDSKRLQKLKEELNQEELEDRKVHTDHIL